MDTLTPPANIDEYIIRFPPEIRERLAQIRAVIRAAAPDAAETISYQMPTFTLQGNLIHFAAFKNHIGLYPTPAGTAEFAQELSGYASSKGAVRLPHDQPIPFDLISRMVKFRVQDNLMKAERKAKEKNKR
jgi:uncharacterized protein YdhG (YjbR/CyaY superfamily)